MTAVSAGLTAAKPQADIPLVLSFRNAATDGIASDSPGYYVHGVENVLAILQPSGNLRLSTQLDTRAAAQRRICVDFGTQFGTEPPPFDDGNPRQCVNAMQPMHAYPTGDIAIASLRYGQSVDKLTRFEWTEGASRYRVGYGTDLDRDGQIDSPPVRVTCIAPMDATAMCSTWMLSPSTDGTAVLYRFPIKRGTVQESEGERLLSAGLPFAQTFWRQ